MTNGACEGRACLQTIGGRSVRIHGVRFRAAGFDPTAFAVHGVDRPACIIGSVRQRQAEFFYGRLAARHALAAAGVEAGQVGIGARRQPLFPPGVRGSITHTHTLAAAVVLPSAACRGIGIDIEPMLEEEGLDSVEQMALGTSERHIVRQQTVVPYATACTLVFSAKESFYKALSATVGYIFEFSALDLLDIDFAHSRARFLLTQDLSSEWRAGARCVIDFRVLPTGEMLTGFLW